jgi:hypothetical protein
MDGKWDPPRLPGWANAAAVVRTSPKAPITPDAIRLRFMIALHSKSFSVRRPTERVAQGQNVPVS